MSTELANLIAKLFIARSDAKAVQHTDGSYAPVVSDPTGARTPIKWSREDVLHHLDKSETFGHYLIDPETQTCKLFALDIDFVESALVPNPATPLDWENYTDAELVVGNPRELWRDRSYWARSWLKLQLHRLAHELVREIESKLDVPVAVAYSGNKGLHVYGFTGRISAADAREAALIALDLHGKFAEVKGRASTFQTPAYMAVTVEVFPKQDQVSASGFGNLMRLPLGRNNKAPKDPTFFVDMTSALNELQPIDPLWALGEGSRKIFARPGE